MFKLERCYNQDFTEILLDSVYFIELILWQEIVHDMNSSKWPFFYCVVNRSKQPGLSSLKKKTTITGHS